MIRNKAIIKIVGYLLLLETMLLLLCAAVSAWYGDSALRSLLLSAAITGAVGTFLGVSMRNEKLNSLSRRDGYLMVSLTWVAFAAFGMLPFLIDGHITNVADAFFEAMSGLTCTGASILNDIDNFPRGLLLWRSLSHWIGGLGIIMITIAVLPFFGVNSLQMFAVEVSGPTVNKVNPRIGRTAQLIWMVYTGMTLLLIVLLALGGMGIFDSVCHAMSVMATGGFSTHQDSIAYYNSPYIEYVLTFFMFVSGINFNLLILLVMRRFSRVFHNGELRWYATMIGAVTLLFAASLYLTRGMGAEESLRKSLFQIVSLQTSTGLVSEDYGTWPMSLTVVLFGVMIVGGCAGSTSGGMKCIRLQVLVKVAKNEFKHILHPNAVLPVRLDQTVSQPSLITTVMAFCFLYIAIIFVAAFLLSAMGINVIDAFGLSVSSIGNMGVAFGSYGPIYSWSSVPDAGKWLLSALMLLGRVEIFTVLLLFTPHFWRRS